jgi:hypothetical protein
VDAREEFKYDDKIVAGLNAYIEKNLETAWHAHKAGVKFAMGSDAVFSMFLSQVRRTTVPQSSPVGTAELSPGRSPGLACTIDKSRRDD